LFAQNELAQPLDRSPTSMSATGSFEPPATRATSAAQSTRRSARVGSVLGLAWPSHQGAHTRQRLTWLHKK
jgi:hypothetical protein